MRSFLRGRDEVLLTNTSPIVWIETDSILSACWGRKRVCKAVAFRKGPKFLSRLRQELPSL